MPLDIELRRDDFCFTVKDLDVDVWRAARICHRFDGAEFVAAIGAGDVMAKALKCGIEVDGLPVASVKVLSVHVALPNLNPTIRKGFARAIENPAFQNKDFASSLLDGPKDFDKIVVHIWTPHGGGGIERPFGRARCQIGGESRFCQSRKTDRTKDRVNKASA